MRRLLGSFERSLSLLNAITDGVIAQGSNNQLVYMNDAVARMGGYESAEAALSVSLTELTERLQIVGDEGQVLTPSQLPGYAAANGQEVPEREYRYHDAKTGETAWLAIKAHPVISAEGGIQFAVSILRDVTQRKQLEAQSIELLAERERVKVLQRFVSDMSHDFRTPLAILSSSLYLMQKNTDPDKQKEHALKATHQIQRMEKLLSELLQSARLDENKVAFHLREIDVNTFLEPIINEYNTIAVDKDIHICFVPKTDGCEANLDAVEFDHAFRNLMENAIAYTLNGGSITIKTGTLANETFISVEDTGIGISSHDLPHIFERFYRADQARSTNTGGNGLGLSIVKRIIEGHKGSVDVQSEPGTGTKFVIRLPSPQAANAQIDNVWCSEPKVDVHNQ
jgi:PAS domain S-box-containing protein